MTTLATIMITTKNRKDDLRKAIVSAVAQRIGDTPAAAAADPAIEVMVVDDGSTDGTPEMVCSEFPSATLLRFETSAGYIHRRNQGSARAKGRVVFSIDDDAAFTDPRTVEQTLRELDHPRIGAVAMAHVDVNFSPDQIQRAPDQSRIWVGAHFRGTAYAIRKDLFLALGGYKRILVHQTEEPELCVRMLARGYAVRYGSAPPIHHFESPKRSYQRQYYFNARNHILLPWFNCPWRFLPVQWAGSIVRTIRNSARQKCLWPATKGMIAGFWRCVPQRGARRPVPAAVYHLFRAMRNAGPRPLADVESIVPPSATIGGPDPRLLSEIEHANP